MQYLIDISTRLLKHPFEIVDLAQSFSDNSVVNSYRGFDPSPFELKMHLSVSLFRFHWPQKEEFVRSFIPFLMKFLLSPFWFFFLHPSEYCNPSPSSITIVVCIIYTPVLFSGRNRGTGDAGQIPIGHRSNEASRKNK